MLRILACLAITVCLLCLAAPAAAGDFVEVRDGLGNRVLLETNRGFADDVALRLALRNAALRASLHDCDPVSSTVVLADRLDRTKIKIVRPRPTIVIKP